jgi:ubiquinone/menaquinone biosynthesis C-methylase UbiE
MPDDLREYYSRRAREYESMYERDDPVRQAELAEMRRELCAALADRRVLEVACGTGYWTHAMADVARHVVAIDVAEETLAVAREKPWPPGKVEFRIGDAYALDATPGDYDAGAAMFWLSHVPKARMAAFLTQFHRALGPGATVFMADNTYIPGLGGELIARPNCEDTYKRRQLDSGERYDVLKNYYSRAQLQSLLEPHAASLRIHCGRCYWWLAYDVRLQRGRRGPKSG